MSVIPMPLLHLERVAGIEPASSAWKAEVIATIRHPRKRNILRLFRHLNIYGSRKFGSGLLIPPLSTLISIPGTQYLTRVSSTFHGNAVDELSIVSPEFLFGPTHTISFADQGAHKRWWRGVDSNHRRQCQQIYSLSPLATREPLQSKGRILYTPPGHVNSGGPHHPN